MMFILGLYTGLIVGMSIAYIHSFWEYGRIKKEWMKAIETYKETIRIHEEMYKDAMKDVRKILGLT